MKLRITHRILSMLLAVSLTLSMTGSFAFANEGGIAVGYSDPEGSESVTPGDTNTTDCTCDPAPGVSGFDGHGIGCPLYIDAEKVAVVYALIDALPTVDELTAVDTKGEGFPAYLEKLRADALAARTAYDALTEPEKAAFDTESLAKLTVLEEVLAAIPMLMAEGIPVLTENAGVFSYQNVKYALIDTTNTAMVNGVASSTNVIGDDGVLTIPPKVQKADGTVYDVTEIKSFAFNGYIQLMAVTVPESVTKIGTNAFQGIDKYATVTLLHETCPLGIKDTSFLNDESNALLFIKATPTVAAAVGKDYLNDSPYGILVTELPVPDFNNSNGSLKLARSQSGENTKGGYTVLGIKGEKEILTTYSDEGYLAYLSTTASPSIDDSSLLRLPGEGAETYVKSGIWAKAKSEFVAGGQYLRVTYTLRNSTNAAISNVSLGVGADVKIGSDDYADIYPTPTGFRMVNSKTTGDGTGMQFTLNCTNALGADNVSTMWYGRFDTVNTLGENLFTDLADKTEITGGTTDSVLAFSWTGMSIPAGGSISKSVVFGVGEAAAPPALPSDPTQKPIALYLTATGEKDITVNAKVIDTAGVTDTLYYTINDGAEQTLGETVTADGNEQVISGVIGADNFIADGDYEVKLWIMNSKGAMSEVITKKLTVSSGAMGGAGLETGEAPEKPTPPVVDCTCVVSAPTFANGSITIPADQASTTSALSASGSALSGDCTAEGHSGASVSYSYAEKTDTSNIASITGNTLTVTGAGTVVITATATANGKTATTDATFTVTKAAANKITIKVNDVTTPYGGADLQAAVTAAGGASSITKLTVTAGEVTETDWNWLKNLTKLTHFTIDATVTSIEEMPDVKGDASLFPQTIQQVTIPQAIKVGISAFYKCLSLTTVNMPAATAVGAFAFWNCSQLATVDLRAAITIGENAFSSCKALTAVNLPKVTKIYASAFSSCDGLTAVTLPEVTRIYEKAFSSCYGLITVDLPIATIIDKEAFSSCKVLTTVKLPAAQTIGNSAFSGCVELATVNLPAAQTIGNSAFNNCVKLETATLPVATTISDKAFYNCTALTTVKLPAAKTIGTSTFYNCQNLKSVSLPVATDIGNKAFQHCNGLATLMLGAEPPEGVDQYTFDGCPRTALILVDEHGIELTGDALTTAEGKYKAVDDGMTYDNKWWGWSIGKPAPAITILVNNTKTASGDDLAKAVKAGGLEGSQLKHLKVTGGKVVATDWTALRTSGYSLETFEIAEGVEVADIPSSKGGAIFESSITSIIIPQAIAVGDYAFTTCINLTTVSIPNATEIGERAFYLCKKLPKLELSKAAGIGNYAFYGCEALTEMKLHAAKTIGKNAFNNCIGLNKVSLPIATAIGDEAFFGCKVLTTVELPAAKTIGGSAFRDCVKLTSADLPNATRIEYLTFGGCVSLTSVSLLKATVIDADAFSKCALLTEVSLPNVESIVGSAFTGCVKLGTLKLPAKPPSAVRSTFGDCAKTNPIVILGTDGKPLEGVELTSAVAAYQSNKPGYDSATEKWWGWKLPAAPAPAAAITILVDGKTTAGGATLALAVKASKVSSPKNLKVTGGKVTKEDWIALPKASSSLETFEIAEEVEVADIPNLSENATFPNSIQQVTIPQAIAVGDRAFYTCRYLTKVSIPNATGIGENAFNYCTKLTTVELPKATSIGTKAFFSCEALTKVSIPNATGIGENAFYGCVKLGSVSMSNATTIGNGAFDKCTPLAKLELPRATTIGNYAFRDCKELTSADLSGAISIGKGAFQNCSKLLTLKLPVTPPKLAEGGAFERYPNDHSAVIVDAQGKELTGAALTSAVAAYKAEDDSAMSGEAAGNDTWHTWKLPKALAPVAVTGVSLNKTTLSLEAGKSETLTATVAPANATNQAVSWTTSAADVVAVDKDGRVTAVKPGTATVTVTTTDGGKTATCAVTVTPATTKPAPGGELTAPLTQDKVDGVFGEGNATLDNATNPPKITVDNSITVEKPIEIETDVTIDLGGNTITGQPGQPPIIVGDGDNVTVGGDGTISGGDNTGGTGGNGITGGADSGITVGGGVTVEGGDGTTGGAGIESGGNVTVDGSVSGGDGSSGDGGSGVDTSGGTGDVTIGGDGSAEGGNGTTGGDGVTGGGNVTVDGSVSGGDGSSGDGGSGVDTSGGTGDVTIGGDGSAEGGNGTTGGDGVTGGGSVTVDGSVSGGDGSSGNGGDGVDTSGGSGDITIGSDGSATGGNSTGGNGNGGNGTSSGGDTIIGGDATGGNGNGSGSGGNGATDTAGGSGSISVPSGGSSAGGDGGENGGSGGDGVENNGGGSTTIGGETTGGNGGSSSSGTGGAGGNGSASTGSGDTTISGGGSTSGGSGGSSSSGTGGAGGSGSTSTGGGSIEVGGETTGGNGGSGSTAGGNGGNGASSGSGGTTVNNGGSATGGTGGTGSATGGNGGNGASSGSGDTTISGGGSATGGTGGSGSTAGGNGGNGASSGNTTVNGGATGGNGGHGTPGSNGNGGNGGNGANQGGGTVDGSGTATGGNGGSSSGTGSGGTGGAGVGGGATHGSSLIVKNGISAKVEVVGDAKTEVKLPDPAKTVDAVLTDTEKADKDITDVKVTLKVDDKTAAKPDKAAIEAEKPTGSIIGAFFDITLKKTVTKTGGSPITTDVTDTPNKQMITITIEIPSAMQGGSDYVVIRVHKGSVTTLHTEQSGNDLTFRTDKFSTYAIAYNKGAPSQGGDDSDSTDWGGTDWGGITDQITDAGKGGGTGSTPGKGNTVTITLPEGENLPDSVLDAMRQSPDVTLVIKRPGKPHIIIPAGKAPKKEEGRFAWTAEQLEQLFAGSKLPEIVGGYVNPVTGGIRPAPATMPPTGNIPIRTVPVEMETNPPAQAKRKKDSFVMLTLMMTAAAVASGIMLFCGMDTEDEDEPESFWE